METVHALWLLAEPDAERPGLGIDGPQRDAQPAREGGHQAALNGHREAHDHEDDLVGLRGARRPGIGDHRAKQDRHGALEAGPQEERPLVARKPDRRTPQR